MRAARRTSCNSQRGPVSTGRPAIVCSIRLREDGYVTFDETNALFGLTPQVRTLSEGVSSRDLSSQAALPAMFSLLDQVSWPSDFGVFELGSVLIRESTHPFSPFSVHRSMVGRRRSLVRSALGKAILAASPPALRREMLDLTASLVEEDAGLAKDRRFIEDISVANEEGRLRIVGRRIGSRHQRHRTGYSGRRPRSRQPQSDLLLVVDDARGRRPKVSAQHEDGREGNRASVVRSEQGARKGRLISATTENRRLHGKVRIQLALRTRMNDGFAPPTADVQAKSDFAHKRHHCFGLSFPRRLPTHPWGR